ncbi:MAG: relaxase [Clostridiales bacterium]|nr:relaxase [Clostridiales bacterium]
MIEIAVTGIWKISKDLNYVVEYTSDIEKTKNKEYANESYYNLHNVIDYVEAEYKTEKQFYVSGLNCSPETAYEEMIITKQQFNKTGGILGFHAFQSFKEGEVTPERAHAIGVKLAEEMWGDRFEVVVSTHLNTNHYHNHFVINSVSFVDGKRYYDKRETYAELRRLSDCLCEEYGLSVVKEKPCRRSKIDFTNYQKVYTQRDNYYTLAKQDLDRAIAQAYSYSDFEKLMKAMDYEIYYRANKISIRRNPYKKNIRIERYFGDEYSIENIKERIINTQATRIPFIEEYGNKKNNKIFNYQKPRKKGFYGLYLHYCYLLKVFPKKYPYQRLTPTIRADVRKMEEISNEARLLVRNNLKTNEQFFLFKTEKEKQLDKLMDERSKLWYRYKKSKSKEEQKEIKKQIDLINNEINPLRKEVVLCNGILERSPKLEENLKELNEESGKEVEKNEFIR